MGAEIGNQQVSCQSFSCQCNYEKCHIIIGPIYIVTTVLHSAIFHRFLQLALILTGVITTLLFVKYADKPSNKLYGDVDFTKLVPFNVTALIENGTDAAVWDSQEGLLGLNGHKDPPKSGYNVFLEMHTHTIHSDGVLTPKQGMSY